MRPTQGSLMARLAKLEHRHAPRLAFAGEVRLFGPDGERIDDAALPPPPAGRRVVVNIQIGAGAADTEDALSPPAPAAPPPEPAMPPANPDPAPVPPAPSATPRPIIVPEGPLVLGRPGDRVVSFGEALARARLRGDDEWRDND